MDHFYETAKRMYQSSKTLHDNGEYHNACYLAGYVIECYAKIIIGMSYGFATNDQTFKELGHDLRRLNTELLYILNHSRFSAYMVNLGTEFTDIYSGQSKWNPIKRYSQINWSQQDSNNFQNQILRAMQQLAQMSLDTSSNLI